MCTLQPPCQLVDLSLIDPSLSSYPYPPATHIIKAHPKEDNENEEASPFYFCFVLVENNLNNLYFVCIVDVYFSSMFLLFSLT